MLIKLILSHVILDPRCSMIANRTIQPSYHSLKSGVTSNGPLTSSFCCCSLKIKDTGLLARFYSTQGYHDGRTTRDSLGRNCLRSIDSSERETLRQRLNAFAHQERKSSSVQRFESCYRQIYPSKKRKATFKIPKKQPYIPAVYQKRTTSYRDKYKKVELEPKGRRLQWPPLYPPKRKDYIQPIQAENKSQGLPSWLLPLYSCKACHASDTPSTSEARFSGGAFRRRMEIIESVKQIRANQPVLLGPLNKKGTKKDDRTPLHTVKSSNAVEALKRKIDSMQDYLSAMKNMEAYRKKYQPRQMTNETELSEKLVREAFARIYQIEPPTQEKELRERNSVGLGVAGPKSLGKPLSVTSNIVKEQCLENGKETDNNNEILQASKNQHDEGVAQTREVESNSMNQAFVNKYSTTEARNKLTLGNIHKESPVMIKQPSWKQLQIPNRPKNNEPTPSQKKQQILSLEANSGSNQNNSRPRQSRVHGEMNTTSILNHQQQSRNIRIQETKTIEDGGKTVDAWTVESLKSRINFMKIKNTLDEPSSKKAEDMSITRNGGEAKPKISQVAMRSFHKEAGVKNARKVQFTNAAKVRLGFQRTVGRRNFSTFRASKSDQPGTRALGHYRRTIFNTPLNMNKKRDWVSRIRRCFVFKKIKGYKCENWKKSPREIPYEKKEVKCNSPTPVLWKPKDLGDNRTEHKTSNPPEKMMLGERVNPVVLNAEQRILASLSRLITTKPHVQPSQVPVIDIEKKIRRAKHKVNLMPWLKRSKSTDTLQKLPQLRGSYNKVQNEESHESGYEWILKNRDMVEELKRRSQSAAGKSLVPAEVKHSINKYKLPLKAEIAQYRKNIDQRCSENVCLYSTSKRWYSTGFAGTHGRILSCSDVILVNTRGFKTIQSDKENSIPSKFLDRKTRSDIVLRSNLRQYNQGVPNNICDIDAHYENRGEEKRLKRWTWKVPNKTRAFTPNATNLTSPSKIVGTRMSEMSPCALKKQVEELKRLIKKAREEVTEKTDESLIDPQSEGKHEARLKRLVKAAHNNAQKMQIVEPKYTSENHMMAKKSSNAKKNSTKPMTESTAKSENSKHEPEASVLKSLFKKKNGEAKSMADEILQRNNLSSLPASASNKKPEKTISKVYLKLKLLVEAVRKKSAMLDPINEVKLLSSKSPKGSISTDSMLLSSASILKKTGKPENIIKSENSTKETPSSVMVELQAKPIPAPSNTIQLWKGDSKPKEFNFLHGKEPTYGDLLTLFTKAKELFYYQPPEEDKTAEAKLETILIPKDNNVADQKNILTQDDLTKNWLSIREDVSSAARAVSELKDDQPKEVETISKAQPSSLVGEKQRDSGVNTREFMMTKSNMIPVEILRSDSRISCDHMWANVSATVPEDEDICRTPSSKTNSTDENQFTNQVTVKSKIGSSNSNEACSKIENDSMAHHTKLLQSDVKSYQQESQNPIDLESTKMLFQKPLAAWESLTKNFGTGVGRGLFRNAADIPNNARQESMAMNNETTCTHQQLNTELDRELKSSPNEISNLSNLKNDHFHDINKQSQSILASNIISHCSHEGVYNQEMLVNAGTNKSNSTEKQTNNPNDRYVNGCTESMKPLEENVKKFENYYRVYFTEDIASGYEHLHQVYEGLNKLSTVVQYQGMDNLFITEMEARKEAFAPSSQNTLQTANTLTDRNLEDFKSHGSIDIHSDGQTLATEIKKAGTVNQQGATATATSGTIAPNPSGSDGLSVTGPSNNSMWTQQPNAPGHASITGLEPSQDGQNDSDRPQAVLASCNTKQCINSPVYMKEGFQTQETEVPASQPDKTKTTTNLESCSKDGFKVPEFNGVNGKDESANFEQLLTQDPTLNPEVVKNLKLPVILSEDCHSEKNWYTKFYSSPHRKR